MMLSTVSFASFKPIAPTFSHAGHVPAVMQQQTNSPPEPSSHRRKFVLDAWQPGDENLPLPRRICLSLIWMYQKLTHFQDKDGVPRNRIAKCPYAPHCSLYTSQAIREYGVFEGIWLGFKRILRCNPLTVSHELKKQGKESFFKYAWQGRLDELRDAILDPIPMRKSAAN